MQKYVFGYGSLMNPLSLKKTIPGERRVFDGNLRGYRRVFNMKTESNYLALNICPHPEMAVQGKLCSISPDELENLKIREYGYDCVEVSALLNSEAPSGQVYTFIAPNDSYPHIVIPLSYMLTCLEGVAIQERNRWIDETLIESEIINDLDKPLYKNAAYELVTASYKFHL